MARKERAFCSDGVGMRVKMRAAGPCASSRQCASEPFYAVTDRRRRGRVASLVWIDAPGPNCFMHRDRCAGAQQLHADLSGPTAGSGGSHYGPGRLERRPVETLSRAQGTLRCSRKRPWGCGWRGAMRRRMGVDPATNRDLWGRGWRGGVPHRAYLDPAAQKAVVVGRGEQTLAPGGAIRIDPPRSATCALKQL